MDTYIDELLAEIPDAPPTVPTPRPLSAKDKLLRLLRGKDREADAMDWFAALSSCLQREWLLQVGARLFNLAEIEFYLHNGSHPDPFVHQHPQQLTTCGQWYFHREKSASRTFTLKGLDLTFGVPGGEYGGILIRCVREVTSGTFTEGPCKVVDMVLDEHQACSVSKLKEAPAFTDDVFSGTALMLVSSGTIRREPIFASARFGLKSKKADHGNVYLVAPYRFRMWPETAKKGKSALIAGQRMEA